MSAFVHGAGAAASLVGVTTVLKRYRPDLFTVAEVKTPALATGWAAGAAYGHRWSAGVRALAEAAGPGDLGTGIALVANCRGFAASGTGVGW